MVWVLVGLGLLGLHWLVWELRLVQQLFLGTALVLGVAAALRVDPGSKVILPLLGGSMLWLLFLVGGLMSFLVGAFQLALGV